MFDSLLNSIYLKLWTGNKKVGPHRRVHLSKSYESYADQVFDLTWKLRYVHANGKASHAVYITQRASKWNVRRIIRHIEKHRLRREIEALVSRSTHVDRKDSKH